MSENITRLFSFDTGIHNWHQTQESKRAAFPKMEKSLIGKEEYLISPIIRKLPVAASLDHRIRESIKPAIADIEVLRPKRFKALLNETHSALAKEVEETKAPEAKEAIDSLISLLKENVDLVNLFQNYTNWLQKA